MTRDFPPHAKGIGFLRKCSSSAPEHQGGGVDGKNDGDDHGDDDSNEHFSGLRRSWRTLIFTALRKIATLARPEVNYTDVAMLLHFCCACAVKLGVLRSYVSWCP